MRCGGRSSKMIGCAYFRRLRDQRRFRLLGFERIDIRFEVGGVMVSESGAPDGQALEQTELIEKSGINYRSDHHAVVLRAQLVFQDVGDMDRGERGQLF